MLHDLTVHNMVVGGPVYMSGNIEIGDTIIKVDGKGVSLDDYEEAFVGCDVPGSKVQLTVRKKKGGEVDISIVRIARSEMAGRVQLFEQFTTLTDLASQSGDSQLMAAVEDTINSSTKLMAESDSRDTKAVHNILQLQLQCSTTLLQLKAGLKELRASFDSTVEEYTNEIMQLQKRLKAQEALVSKLQAELQGNPVHDLAEEKSSPNKSFHVNRPKYSESMGLGDLLETCREVCENLERTISTNVLAVTTAQHQQQDFHTTSTVGIMLQDLTIDNLVVGGPAYRCKQLDKGDVILRVDGVEVVLETIQQQITGTDLPGSEVTLTVMKGEGALQGEVLDVTIRKMARVEMADHVKMFELFTTIKEVAMVDNPDGAEKVDECISLWTRMLLADAAHAGTVAANVRSMQTCGIQQTRAIQEGLDEMKGLKRKTEEERRQALMRRVAKRMLNQTMAAALERWTVNACELARQRCIMDRILKRMLRGKMSAAYQQWCSNAAEKKVMGAKVGKVVGRWMNRCVGQAIEAWHEYSMEEARRRNVMTRAARRLEKRGVVLALELWKANVIEALEDCAEEERRDAILGKVVKRMLHATLASGLLRWQEQVWELRRHRKLLSIQVHDLMERSVGRLLHRTLWFAMDLWQQNVSGARQGRAEEERRNAVMQRVVKRMMHAALAASFLRWRDNVRELRWQQGVMERVARRMKNAGMFAAFQRWRENITEKEAMEATSTRVVLRWKLQAVARCLERWRELTAEEGQKRDLMGRIVARMLLRSLLFAMDRWQQNMLAVKQERAEEERRQALMRRVAKRMLNQTMAAALERWTVNACELARQRCIMDRILKRMLRGKMSAAYQQWCSNAAEKKVMGAKVGKVVGRWMNRCVGQAIEAWHEYSMEEARRRWEHRNEQFSQELHEMNVKLLESKDQELCSIKGSLARLEGKFDEQNESFQNRLADTKFNHILVQWKYKAITFCLDTWRRNIYVMRRLQRNIEKVMNRLRAKLFHEWLSRRIFSNRTRRTSRKIMQERHRTLLIIAYKKWKVFGQREAKLCRVTERFLRKMRKLKSFHTLMMWSSRVDYEKCHRLASQKAISFWVASVKTTVCARWSQLVSRKKSLRRASTACARINLILWGINKSFMLSFNAWALTCAESGRLKKAGSIIFNRSTRLGLSCSVQTWRDATKKERGLCKLISRSASESVAVCFKRWRAKVFEKKSVRHLRERTTRKVWRILLMRALSRWMDMLKLDHELKSENAFCELQFSRNQLLNAEDDLRKQIESLQLLLDSEQRTFINHAALVVQSLQSLDKQVSDMQYIIEIVRQQIEQQKHAQMKAEHDITELQKRNLDIESVCEAQTAALMTVEQERSKALAVKDAEIEHLKCFHGHISAEKQDEVERMKLAQEESTQAIVKIEKKRSQRASAPVSKVPAPEWKEKLRRSLVLSERLRKRVRDDVLAVETAVVTSNEFIQKTTVSALHCITANCCAYSLNFAYLQVGIMFSGTGQVESVMIGSPAYLSGKVQKGDFIVEVDGKSVSGSTVLSAIIGEDIPGSYLTLTLKRDGNMVYVNLKRIPTADVADKRRMFDLFTLLKDRAKKDQDWNAVKYVEETLLLWEKMTSADQIHDDQIVENVKSMQTDCTYCSDEISALLLEIWRQQNWGDAPDVRAVDDPIELCSFSPMPTPRLAVLALFRVQTIPTRGDEQGRFKDDLRKELAEASGHPVGIFLIHEMQGGHVEVEILQDPTGTGPDASQILENLVRQSKDPMSTLRTGRICCHLEVVCHRPSGTSAALDHSQVIFP
jgi:C-terminal processing protease CtpA/Prc